jgi:hypothetical protein
MHIPTPVDSGKQVGEKASDLVKLQCRIIPSIRNQQVLGERHLALSQDCVGLSQQFLWPRRAQERHVTLTPQGQKQWVYSSGIHGMHFTYSWKYGRNDWARQVMDELAERRVLLRWSSHHRKGPDGPLSTPDPINLENGKVVLQAVVAQVIAKRAFREQAARVDRATQAEICVSIDRKTAGLCDHANSFARKRASKRQLTEALGQRHHGGKRHGGVPAHKHVDPEWLIQGTG